MVGVVLEVCRLDEPAAVFIELQERLINDGLSPFVGLSLQAER